MGARSGRVGGAAAVFCFSVLVLGSGPSGPAPPDGGSCPPPRQEAACAACHSEALRSGHPVGVAPRRALPPEGWPLDRHGRLACRTCHEGGCRRGSDGGSPAAAGKILLRGGERGAAFCSECHRPGRSRREGIPDRARPGPVGPRGPASWDSSPVRHPSVFGVAHPALAPEGASTVDEASLQCLGCHDGTVAGGNPGTGSPPKIGEASASHPIGIAYPPRPRPGSDGTFHPAASLPSRILLPEGRVGCLSCHDLFSGEEKLLVMANTGSRLCYACHDI